MSTRGQLAGAGWKAMAAMPREESMPAMLKVSLREMGRPWRGPKARPVRSMWSSSSLARARARSKKISVRQLVS